MNTALSLEKYDELLAPARNRFETSIGLNAIRSSRDPRLLEAFLLYFCAIGSQMTEPVERWIRRAAHRCMELGLTGLAEALEGHARAEAGHHLMMIADLRSLAAHWNSRHTPPVDVDELLRTSPGAGAFRYCKVHEENIAGNTPYAQIAIEYEIEQLPLRYGGLFVSRCIEIFGPEILPSLSFVTEHIELDIGHTKFNAQQLSKLIGLVPEGLPSLVAAGNEALDAYSQFLTDCLARAEDHCQHFSERREAPPAYLSWQLHRPVIGTIDDAVETPRWVEEVRSLRAITLYDQGRRPQFRTSDGRYVDPDPIDLYSWHVLAYAGDNLVGCVRVYPVAAGSAKCLTETLLGEEQFTEMLLNLDKRRDNTFEIGRWVVNSRLAGHDGLAPGIGIQLAAASGSLALALANQSADANGVVIFSTGMRDKRHLRLACLGFRSASGIAPVVSSEYDDMIQVMYCTKPQELQVRFQRTMEAMAQAIGLDQISGL